MENIWEVVILWFELFFLEYKYDLRNVNKVLHVANKQKKTFVSRLAGFCVLGGEHGTTWCLNRETVLKILGPFRRGVSRFRRFAFRVLGTPRFCYWLRASHGICECSKEIKGSLPSSIPNRKAFSKMKNIKSTISNEVTSIETVAVVRSSEDQLNKKLDSISLLLESIEDSVVYESSEVTPSELFAGVNDQHTEQTHSQK